MTTLCRNLCWVLLFAPLALAQVPPGEAQQGTTKDFENATLLALAAEQSQRQSPLEVVTTFLEAAHAGDFGVAASTLDLEHVPQAARAVEGPRLARRLMFLLDQQLSLEPEQPGKHDPSATTAIVGELPLRRLQVPVELVRQPAGTPTAWKFSPRTVRSVDALFEEHGSTAWEVLPQPLVSHTLWVLGAWQWLGFLFLLGLSYVGARLTTAVVTRVLTRLVRISKSQLDDELVLGLRRPGRALLFLVALALGTRALAFPATAQGLVDDVLRSAVVATLVWALLVVSRLVAKLLEDRAATSADGRSARAVRTQVSVLHRVVDAVVLVVGGALVLLQFPGVRHIGMSMLASAGVAGVVIGLAAQRSIANLLAGVQISLTQPIRIGDTVIVENEWGWIEEITLTYVVVKVWDLRRLVVPISSFLEKPFQNWSRTSTDILGTVELFSDYEVDVDAARAELARIVEPERGKLWDGKVAGIQVTGMSDRALTLRVLVSSADAGQNWDLRCLVREKLVSWLRQQPGSLPRVRTEGSGVPAAALRKA